MFRLMDFMTHKAVDRAIRSANNLGAKDSLSVSRQRFIWPPFGGCDLRAPMKLMPADQGFGRNEGQATGRQNA